MLAVHVGVLDEDVIWNMRYPFFNQCLIELGLKLNYAAVVNYAGNAFAEKSWEFFSCSRRIMRPATKPKLSFTTCSRSMI